MEVPVLKYLQILDNIGLTSMDWSHCPGVSSLAVNAFIHGVISIFFLVESIGVTEGHKRERKGGGR